MNLEVELKFAVSDQQALEQSVIIAGYKLEGTTSQVDIYFQHPERDFAITDEAFRIRFDNQQGYLTYKGPLEDSIAKTRKEIEIPMHPQELSHHRISEMLSALGFRMVQEVRKVRSLYARTVNNRSIHLCIDQVDGLGIYVEIETIAQEVDKDLARDALILLAQELKLTQIERRSYLRLLLAKQS